LNFLFSNKKRGRLKEKQTKYNKMQRNKGINEERKGDKVVL
jgi:hypothetical protein